MAAQSSSFDPQLISKTCISVVESTIQQMSSLTFSQAPAFAVRDIIEYKSRMRVFSMEVFNAPCYVSAVNYYLTPKHLEKRDASGAFVLYLEEKAAGRILKALYRGLDDDDEAAALNASGEFCKVLGGNFKNALSQMGYVDLTMSEPQNFHNVVPDGIEFNYDEYVKYETSFYLWKEKALAVDITLSPPPKK